jgi:hypothetical protein
VVGVAPGAVVAHHLVAHFHQRQAAPVVVGVVVFPHVVVRRHVVRAVAAVVQLVAPKGGVVRHVHIQRIAHEADVVARICAPLGVVELDAVAALGESKSRLPVMRLCSMRTSLPSRSTGRTGCRSGRSCAPRRGARRGRGRCRRSGLSGCRPSRARSGLRSPRRGVTRMVSPSQPAAERGAVEAAQREGLSISRLTR